MKLYLLTRKEAPGNPYDKMMGLLIAADNEKDACEISLADSFDWVENESDIDIQEIGEANSTIEKGIIMEDYCNG